MSELRIDNKIYELPESWNDVTVKQYREMYNLDEDITDFERRIEMMKILTPIESELIDQLNIEHFSNIEQHLLWFNEPIVYEDKDYIELDGDKYYFYTDFKKFSIGEVISVELLEKEADGNLLKVYNKLLCIFLRKKDDEGNYEEFKNTFMNRAELFDTAKIVEVNQTLSFFFKTERQ